MLVRTQSSRRTVRKAAPHWGQARPVGGNFKALKAFTERLHSRLCCFMWITLSVYSPTTPASTRLMIGDASQIPSVGRMNLSILA